MFCCHIVLKWSCVWWDFRASCPAASTDSDFLSTVCNYPYYIRHSCWAQVGLLACLCICRLSQCVVNLVWCTGIRLLSAIFSRPCLFSVMVDKCHSHAKHSLRHNTSLWPAFHNHCRQTVTSKTVVTTEDRPSLSLFGVIFTLTPTIGSSHECHRKTTQPPPNGAW